MATSQINVRIDEDLRVQGNLALKAAGYAPSQAIRTLWEFAERHRFEPEVIRKKLTELEKPEEEEQEQQEDHPIYEGWRIVEDGLRALGIKSRPADLHLSNEELRELAFRDRWGEL